LFFILNNAKTFIFDRQREFIEKNLVYLGPFGVVLNNKKITKSSIIFKDMTLNEFNMISKA